MAKMTLSGNALTVTSSIPMEQIEFLQKYDQGSLKLMGGEKKEEIIFMVESVPAGKGSLSEFGASFDGKTRDENGFATITLLGNWPEEAEAARGKIADLYGKAYERLCKLEEQVPTAYDAAKASRDAMMEVINLG